MRGYLLLLGIAPLAFSTPSPALASIGLNQCGAGIKPPRGMHCGQEELLLGYRDAAGACVWVCCPPNSDGRTYDCSAEPTASDFRLDLRSVRPRPWTGVFTPGEVSLKQDTDNAQPQGEETGDASR